MMPTIVDPSTLAITSASRAAEQNWTANLHAIAGTQPALAEGVGSFHSPMEWIFARDGALSAIEGRKWWAGCSLPRRAAEFMLATADLSGTVLCFLMPTTAAQLGVALGRMAEGQALLALIPDMPTLAMILSCEDFSKDICQHRLYFAWGEAWETELVRLLDDNPGLPIPAQFVRPILVDSSAADALVQPAQSVFSACAGRRATQISGVRNAWRSSKMLRRVCLVAPSQFRLWDDAGYALASTLSDVSEFASVRFDPDDPASASPLALAEAAAQCDSLITPNSGRAMLPDLVPMDLPWATWITSPRIPPAAKAGPNDTLILADPAWKPLAIAAGWGADRLFQGGWPTPLPLARKAVPGIFEIPAEQSLTLIFDTHPLTPPPRVEEYSSHRLLWEAIAHELTANPFALRQSPANYLAERMSQASLNDGGFDHAVFVDRLIAHAYAQGLARLLVTDHLNVRLFGAGWDQIEDLRPHYAGPSRTREQFMHAISNATVLVHTWPTLHAHPIHSVGKPVLCEHAGRESFLRNARLALSARTPQAMDVIAPITPDTVRRALSIQSSRLPQ